MTVLLTAFADSDEVANLVELNKALFFFFIWLPYTVLFG